MLNGNKPWQKILFENFLMIFSLMAIVLTRVITKIIYPNFGLLNVFSLIVAFAGFLLLLYSKREQLQIKEFFKFGVSSQNPKDVACYLLGYFLLIFGLILTFVI